MASHETIAAGYTHYHRGKRLTQAGRGATAAGIVGGGTYAGAKYLASGGKAGHSLGHKLFFESTGVPLRFKEPGTRKVSAGVSKMIGERATGVLNRASKAIGTVVHGAGKALTSPIRAPLNAVDQRLAPLAARFASNPARKAAALRVVKAGRRLGVGKWAPRAVIAGGAALAVGGALKFVGGHMIRKGHAENQRL